MSNGDTELRHPPREPHRQPCGLCDPQQTSGGGAQDGEVGSAFKFEDHGNKGRLSGWVGGVQGTLELSPRMKSSLTKTQGKTVLGTGVWGSGAGLSLAGLRSEVTSRAEEGGQEGTGSLPPHPSGPGQEFGLPPEGTGELRRSSEGGSDHFPPLPHLLTSLA